MKIAVCISGHFRKLDSHIDALNRFLINDPLNEYDLFIHTWNVTDRNGSSLNEDIVYKKYKPKIMVIEKPIIFAATQLMLDKNIGKYDINGVMSMFYKIEKCNQLKLDFESSNNFKYDCVIRFRGDVELLQPLHINKDDLHKLAIPLHGDYYGLNDQFAYSNSDVMNKYSSTFSNISDHLVNRVFNPEIFTKETVIKHKLELVRPSVQYIIRRSNNDIFSNSTDSTWG